jgi:hypothetical protein
MSNIDEQELRNYLLGSLTPERHTQLEALAQADENLREEILAVEEELVDQYLAGGLPEAECESFKAQILSTERGQRKLRFAELFARYRNSNPAAEQLAVHSAPAPNDPPIRPSSPLFATFYRNPTFVVLSIFVAGLLIMLVGWLWVGPSPGTSIADTTSRDEVVVLFPDSTRAGGTIRQVTTQAKLGHIKLELELTKADFQKYKMKLFRQNQDKELDFQEELKIKTKDSHYIIPIVVSTEILTPGDYQVKLCGVQDSGQPSTIDHYSFRVTDADDQNDQRDRLAR